MIGADEGKKDKKKKRGKKLKNKKKERYKKIHQEWNAVGGHHVVPRSRGGGNHYSNIKKLDGRAHWCYHRLFGVLTPEESQMLLLLVLRGKKQRWSRKDIKKLQDFIQYGLISEAKKFAEFGGPIKILIED